MVNVAGLKKYFYISQGFLKKKLILKAVDGVSFKITQGETLAVVGESGSGKTTLGRTILRLYEPTDGRIVIKERDITKLSKKELRGFRKHMQMVFQDPYNSLNPKLRVMTILREPFIVHKIGTKKEQIERVFELLDIVGLKKEDAYKYPYEFSGGQRQRISIARAIALNPDFVVLDEPVSSLDVSIQAQILNLLKDLQERFNLTYLFISHDLGVVKYFSQRVAIFYLGRIVELGSKEDIFSKPLHPYTKLLLDSVLDISKDRGIPEIVEGEPPSPIDPPKGCYFHSRCPYKKKVCEEEYPEYREVFPGHWVACHIV